MQIEQRKLSEITPYSKNAKKHDLTQVNKLADSINAFGFNQPVVVDKQGVIIVGHGRYMAAQKLGLETIPVLVLELSEEKAKAYRLADNKLNESDWDIDLVIEELKDLSVPMVELTGFDRIPLQKLEEGDLRDEPKGETPNIPKCKKCGEQLVCESCI